uniref:C-type lectin domain-containing protein n=1 Tax=Biomphalaria glabrata TaxID=6526 RepID=A0A2C9M182_BIOGL
MATRIVVILVICILSFPSYQGRKVIINDIECRKFSGFQAYNEGNVKMCLSYRQDLKNYTDARADCARELNAVYPEEDCACQRCWSNYNKLCDGPCYLAKNYLCEKVI